MIVGIHEIYILKDYILAIIISILIAYALKIPLLPKKPYRFSFQKSALFPTPIFAIGFMAFAQVLNINLPYEGVIAIIVGVFTAFFVKYIFDFLFPLPPESNLGDDTNE
ncbi:energy-converting hydrogenase A subunit A EhaA [Methanobrevibacter sp. OttesenSCG-928-K11]|nr:energy-converting hydrogenase A subunit A EhaA [Methanobrevibacter sp. OttesenSCG-928-K11]MDL2270788.1 energy-converting hydrogenase A subunit A EhaA [Methanobrevibacter sp. OttesenSCG-928-I08]